MAHKKGAGSSRNGRESHSKRLGIKIFGGQTAIAGNIIVRQRGTAHHPDKNVGIGRDHTLFALTDGTVVFKKKYSNKSYVSIIPSALKPTEPIKKVEETLTSSVETTPTEELETAVASTTEKVEKAPTKKKSAAKTEDSSEEEA